MDDGRRELYVRALALPGALIAARGVTAVMPGPVRMLSMWVHETGHAAAAWLTGFSAIPGPWFTPVDDDRSLALTVVLLAALAAGMYHAWRSERWFWLACAGAVLPLTLFGTFGLHVLYARQLIIFGGDGGCFVLGSLLMLTMYAREEHPLRAERLRWVCLALGALAFMDARATWFGDVAAIPFGEDERGFSDPSVLTELYGWALPVLVGRYQQLATACVAVLGCAWVIGLYSLSSFPRTRRIAATH
jgi:hypothetical protein